MAREVSTTPQTTLVVLLGASKWPRWPDLDSEAFANSAKEVRNYFLDPRKFHLPRENLLDLFDSDQSADDIDEAIDQFLTTRITQMRASNQAARDILVYFIGHAGFAEGSLDYYLAIRRTRKNNPETSGLRIVSLAKTVKERTRDLRRILILDCCYAAAALAAFHAQGVGLEEAATIQTLDAFRGPRLPMNAQRHDWPTKGTALLCSSSRGKPSRLGEHYTEFSKALLYVLNTGTADEFEYMSLDMVADFVREFLDETGSEAPRPEVHNPDQREGYVADVPLFPNPQVEERRARQAEEEKRRLAEQAERARRMEEERLRRVEEGRIRQAEEERAHQAEEAKRHQAEEQARRIEEERVRKAKEEQRRQIEEEDRTRRKEEERQRGVEIETELIPSTSQPVQPTAVPPQVAPSPFVELTNLSNDSVIPTEPIAGNTDALATKQPPSTHIPTQTSSEPLTETTPAERTEVDKEAKVMLPLSSTLSILPKRKVSRRRILVGLGATLVVAGSALEIGRLASSQLARSSDVGTPPSSSSPTHTPPSSSPSVPYLYKYTGHKDVVTSVAWSPDGTRIASGSKDKTVQVWDATSGGHALTYRGAGPILSLSWSHDGTRIASLASDKNGDEKNTLVPVWNATNGSLIFTINYKNVNSYGYEYEMTSLAWSPNGSRIATATDNNTVEIWNAANGSHISSIISTRGNAGLQAVTWSPDNTHIAVVNFDEIEIWDTTNGNFILAVSSSGQNSQIPDVNWSPDGAHIAAPMNVGIVIWNVKNGSQVLTKSNVSTLAGGAWSPNSKSIASAAGYSVQVWNAVNGSDIFTYTGHTYTVRCVAWSPKNTLIASGDDLTVQVWKAPS